MTPSELNTDGTPQRALITSRAEAQQAIQIALGSARHLVRALHRDLSPFGLSSVATVERLQTLLLGQREARVRLLVDDPLWLDNGAARLRLLQRRFSHAIELRVASTDDPVGDDCWLIADDHSVLSLIAGRLLRGDLWLNHKPRVQPLAAAFDRRWDAAAHNLPVSPLGLA
jgi:hypothetical protein